MHVMHLKKFLKAYWLHNWNKKLFEKKRFLAIFVKQLFFFGAKKNFDGKFFVEITKKKWKMTTR